MLKGIEAAAAAMVPRLRRQEVIANNLANAATAGFKRDVVFETELKSARSARSREAPTWTFQMEASTDVDFAPGPMDRTDNPLDVAIDGDGFFVVQTDEGERYTRNGHFALSPGGQLVTGDGHPVMGTGGEVLLPPGTVSIGADGTLSVEAVAVGKLRLVHFADSSTLQRSSSSLFVAGPDAVPEDDTMSFVKQGFIERSNVNTIEEMVNMMAMLRGFEADQRAIQVQDETLGRAVNELGRVRA